MENHVNDDFDPSSTDSLVMNLIMNLATILIMNPIMSLLMTLKNESSD